MELNVAVEQLLPGMEVQGYYLLKDPQIKKTANGKPFLSAALADATGSIDAKGWDFTATVDAADNGRVVLVRGEISEYRGTPQFTIHRFRFAGEQDAGKYNMDSLVATAPVDRDGELAALRGMLTSVEDRDYRRVGETALERHLERFSVLPAAKSVHHSFRSGLLMHTGSMLRLADFVAGNYPGLLDRSLLIVGTLLHDLAKEEEFTVSNLGLVTDYSVKGELLGHLVMGAAEAAELCRELQVPEEKSVLLQHMILSHHGQPEMGAAVRPKIAEAEALSLIDLMDSRMEIYAETMENARPGTLLPRVFSLEKRIYKHG